MARPVWGRRVRSTAHVGGKDKGANKKCWMM